MYRPMFDFKKTKNEKFWKKRFSKKEVTYIFWYIIFFKINFVFMYTFFNFLNKCNILSELKIDYFKIELLVWNRNKFSFL